MSMLRFYSNEDDLVHFEGPDGADYFLCGFAPEGEAGNAEPEETRRIVDCPRCIGVIKHCRAIRSTEWKR